MTKKILLLCLCLLIPGAAGAQSWPSRPILVVCPYSPGSAVDLVIRLLSPGLIDQLKTSVVIENRLGAAGMVGTAYVAKAAPDGYTLLYSSPSHYINQNIYREHTPYDPIKDFVPVARISNTPLVLVTAQSSPFSTLQELIAYVHARPGQLNYSSAGAGGATHLPAALLASMANLDITHVPYKNGAEAYTDAMRGEVLMTFVAVSTALPQIKQGTVKAIAVAGASRSPILPNVPTIAESGVPGYQFITWNGMFVRSGTSQEIINRLETTLLKLASAPEFTKRLFDVGLESEPLGTAAFAQRLKVEMPLWAKAVEAGNVKPE